jgi:hypothetical protein
MSMRRVALPLRRRAPPPSSWLVAAAAAAGRSGGHWVRRGAAGCHAGRVGSCYNRTAWTSMAAPGRHLDAAIPYSTGPVPVVGFPGPPSHAPSRRPGAATSFARTLTTPTRHVALQTGRWVPGQAAPPATARARPGSRRQHTALGRHLGRGRNRSCRDAAGTALAGPPLGCGVTLRAGAQGGPSSHTPGRYPSVVNSIAKLQRTPGLGWVRPP